MTEGVLMMAVLDLFSRRQRRLRGEVSDVYTYDNIPNDLRVQIAHIIMDAFTDPNDYTFASKCYTLIVKALRKEVGVFQLIDCPKDSQDELINYLIKCLGTDATLDIIEICFRCIDNWVRDQVYNPLMGADEAIKELNDRFREAGIGYQYESGEIIRVDSQIVHSEMVKPALVLLHKKIYSNAGEEFLAAHKHYRDGRYQECLTSCAKAFESVMKIICDKRRWPYNQKDNASKLVDAILSNGLIPTHFQTQFNALRSMLESGIPTPRNQQSAHGQGAIKIEVPDYLASFLLHQTAATILMLAQAEEAL